VTWAFSANTIHRITLHVGPEQRSEQGSGSAGSVEGGLCLVETFCSTSMPKDSLSVAYAIAWVNQYRAPSLEGFSRLGPKSAEE